EIVRAILLLDGVHPASGFQGQVNKRGGVHPDERAFPESFVVEYNVPSFPATNKVQLVDPNFAFEDYLNDYDRDEFRNELSSKNSWGLYKLGESIYKHLNVDYKHALLWARLKKDFRGCMRSYAKNTHSSFNFFEKGAHHEAAFND